MSFCLPSLRGRPVCDSSWLGPLLSSPFAWGSGSTVSTPYPLGSRASEGFLLLPTSGHLSTLCLSLCLRPL